MDKIKKLEIMILTVLMVPMIVAGIITPHLTKYFIGEATVELIAQVDAIKYILILLVSFISMTNIGLEFISKSFKFNIIIRTIIVISIAMAGPHAVAYRFFAEVVNTALISVMIGKHLNRGLFNLITGDEVTKFESAMQFGQSIALGIGSLISGFINLDIQTFLYVQAGVTTIGGIATIYIYSIIQSMLNQEKEEIKMAASSEAA